VFQAWLQDTAWAAASRSSKFSPRLSAHDGEFFEASVVLYGAVLNRDVAGYNVRSECLNFRLPIHLYRELGEQKGLQEASKFVLLWQTGQSANLSRESLAAALRQAIVAAGGDVDDIDADVSASPRSSESRKYSANTREEFETGAKAFAEELAESERKRAAKTFGQDPANLLTKGEMAKMSVAQIREAAEERGIEAEGGKMAIRAKILQHQLKIERDQQLKEILQGRRITLSAGGHLMSGQALPADIILRLGDDPEKLSKKGIVLMGEKTNDQAKWEKNVAYYFASTTSEFDKAVRKAIDSREHEDGSAGDAGDTGRSPKRARKA
jgi:hypothetical protein